MVTVHDDRKVRYAALDAGITDFLTKPVDAECLARCRNLLTLRRQQLALEDRRRLLEHMVDDATREVKEREKETLLRLARAGEFRDEETGNHLIRMSRYSRLIANTLGLERDEAETIELAAPLHDIGKIGIPDQILLKPHRLEEAEWQVMRRHPVIGHEILKGSASKYVRMGALIALGHHEKYDGSGTRTGWSATTCRFARASSQWPTCTTRSPRCVPTSRPGRASRRSSTCSAGRQALRPAHG